jgi:hypothetical protein
VRLPHQLDQGDTSGQQGSASRDVGQGEKLTADRPTASGWTPDTFVMGRLIGYAHRYS